LRQEPAPSRIQALHDQGDWGLRQAVASNAHEFPREHAINATAFRLPGESAIPASPFMRYCVPDPARAPTDVGLEVMLIILFGLSLMVIIASAIRRPTLFWHKAMLLVAVIVFIAACVALGLEFYLGRS
jgi:hypothetical protein